MTIKLYNTRGRIVEVKTEEEAAKLMSIGFERVPLGGKVYNPLKDKGTPDENPNQLDHKPSRIVLNQKLGSILEAEEM